MTKLSFLSLIFFRYLKSERYRHSLTWNPRWPSVDWTQGQWTHHRGGFTSGETSLGRKKKERNRVKTAINNYSLNILYFHNVFLGCVKLMQLRFLSFKVFPIPSDYNPHVRPDNPVLIWRLELMERRDGSCLTVSCSWSRRPPPRCSHRSMICLILRENK